MKIKLHRKKKRICKILKVILQITGVAGVFTIIGTIGAVEAGHGVCEGLRMMTAGYGVAVTSYLSYKAIDHMEHRTTFTRYDQGLWTKK